ncbi:MAG TPA: hypothetical protein PK047_06905 [Saprospiraceae bacterium]|jgi:hypothetical protein|nr:hypothetical protein [Saprospiraceae bacterium]HRP41966.1 hypothetical protein [Saprospiraceae bacterium]
MLDKLLNIFRSNRPMTSLHTYDRKIPVSRQLRRYNYRVDASLKEWRQAVSLAEDPVRPNRYPLYMLYNRVMEDDQILAQVRTARFNIQMSDYEVRIDNTPNEDLIRLLDSPWFFKYLEYCVDTEMYGYSLIEPITGDDGYISQILIMPREHVAPPLQHILFNPSDDTGMSWNMPPIAGKLIGIGDPDDLGLLKSAAKLIIRKDYNIVDWGRRNERFGIPYITMKTASRDKSELDEKERMLENFGASGWALIDDEDQIDIHEPGSNSSGGHMSFQDFLNYADRCIAFLINGTTASSEQVAYVGNAQVQERQLNKYTLARMRRIQYHINFELFPFLTTHFNYPLANAHFAFKDLEHNEENATINTDNASTDAKNMS